MQDSSKLPVPAMVTNFRALTQMAASELRRVADMVEGSVEQLPKPAVIDDRKTRGDKIRILASFPQSKPFWDDCAHKLECFTCDFQHKPNKEAINRTNWMTKNHQERG
jgi:hypothetical protein